MTLRARISNWQGWREASDLRSWQGWRRYAPAAGSVGAHIVVGAAIVGLIAASSRPAPYMPPILEVMLMPEAETPPPMPPPPAQATPKPLAANDPDAEALPTLPQTARKQEKKPSATQPQTTSAIASTEKEGVYIPPSPFAPGAVGLSSFTADPCKTKGKLQVKDCDTRLSKIEQPKYFEQMTKEEKATYFAGYVPICPYKVGCDGGPWRGLNGAHSVFRPNGGPMMSGGGGLGGINELNGRQGFNPDHTDPGFGD